jgi:acetyl/propionyl-CoA carboxylase alpha subunit/acetyl-CoA carboxylase carboxyltransferase component
MLPRRLLVANRGEIAVRLLRAAAELGIQTVAIYSEDDAESLHTRRADEAIPLKGSGAMAYLDIEQIVALCKEHGIDAVHPGYGFLSENANFARRLGEEGITWIGPRVEMLELFGDKIRAREQAAVSGVPTLPGTATATTVDEARGFFEALRPGEAMIIKAVGGGGGRGMRVIESVDGLEDAFKRCQSEAQAAFGNGAVYVEKLVRKARHVEVQIIGDGSGAVSHIGERDCSVQRRHQKLIEIAPSPGLPAEVRDKIHAAAVSIAAGVKYNSLGTFEFLVDATHLDYDSAFYFIEANPRLQVEHTVTEEVTGIDLVRTQIELAAGATLESLGLRQEQVPAPRGYAIQVRVNMETMRPDGNAMPSAGTLTAFDPPTGPGVRVDTFGYAGYKTSPRYDSLLAKVIAHSPSSRFEDVVKRCYRALSEFRIQGVKTNAPFLQSLLVHPDFVAGHHYTRFIEEHLPELVGEAAPQHPVLYAEPAVAPGASNPNGSTGASTPSTGGDSPAGGGENGGRAGAKIDAVDPLAVLAYGKSGASGLAATPAAPSASRAPAAMAAPQGTLAVETPLQGTVVSIEVREGETVRAGQTLVIMESMKMEHEVKAPSGGVVRRVGVAKGDTLYQGHALLFIEPAEAGAAEEVAEDEVDLDEIRPDLKAVLDRRAYIYDENRPKAVASRAAKGQRTARANVMDLVDPGTWIEYGPLVVANQHSRRSLQDLVENTPTDGMIIGIGNVNGRLFEEPASRVAVICYDYTVLAGTQGGRNHRKTDRMLDVAEAGRMPIVLFAEGGGGRPGDDGGGGGSDTFARFPKLSGLVPMVGITSGRCFAGNASVLGVCDVIIATENSNIGMGGPAMIEGGGLGIFAPEDIGPMEVQVPNGVVDIAVKDEAEAVAVAKKYLSYFQGPLKEWREHDQRRMRRIIPENRLRVYNIRSVIETLADVDSVLELRPGFGTGMITSLIRVEGRPLGVVANNPAHLGGAIDSDGADKAARFMQLCDAFDIPVLHFCDTPGIMVGPEIEKTALVRHSSRMFLVGANLSTPFFTVILRKAYGLGAIAMAGGNYKQPYFTVAWPTGEFGGMGLEGSVKLGYRRELEAIEDPQQRKAEYERRVASAYERGKALNNATGFGIDDTIDPAETRYWVSSLLRSIRPKPPREGKKRPHIDAW